MLKRLAARWGWTIPATLLGLYLGRLASELYPGVIATRLLITIVTVSLSIALLRKQPLQNIWPLMLLFVYVIYPYPDPYVALLTATLTAIVLVLANPPSRTMGFQERYLVVVGIAALILVSGFLIIYLATIAPGILPADSGEFQLIATELGLAHPPGFPLYTLIAHLMTRLPLGDSPALRVNLLSVITSTLTLLIVYLTVQRLTHSIFAGITSSIVLGASATFWAQATTANIRSLTALIAALLFYIFIIITRANGITPDQRLGLPLLKQDSASDGDAADPPPNKRKRFLLALFILVLIAGITHHASLVFIGGVLIIFLLLSERSELRNPRLWSVLLLAGLIGLIPLLYLPLRGASNPLGTPADINTLSGFLNHVLALGFKGDFFYFIQPAALWERLVIMANVLTFQFPTLLIIFMIAGMVFLAFRDLKLALLLGSAFAFHTLATAIYRAPQTVEYMMPAYIPAVILLGYFLGEMDAWRRLDRGSANRRSWQSVLASLLMALSLILAVDQLLDNFKSYRWLNGQTDTRDYALSVMKEAPIDAVILADWHWVNPMRYLQIVEGIRPDLDIHYVFPTSEKYVDTWTRRIEEALIQGNDVIVTHHDEFAYQNLPLPQPIGEAFLFRQAPVRQLPSDYTPYSIVIDGAIQIHGFKVESNSVEVGQEVVLSVAWEPISELDPNTNLFVHLIGQDGHIYGQNDLAALHQGEGLTFTQFRISPRPNTIAGDHTLTLGVYNPETILEQQSPNTYPLSPLAIDLASRKPLTLNPGYRPLAEDPAGQQLVGYDWDNTVEGKTRLYLHWQTDDGFRTQVEDLVDKQAKLPNLIGPWGLINQASSISIDRPASYVPFGQGMVWISRPFPEDLSVKAGQELKIKQLFSTADPLLRDLIVSLRLVGYEDDGFHWAWWDLDDGVPAMGAIPTLKWIAGSKVQDPHWLTVDPDALPGQQVEPLLRLYDAYSNRPLPILDERIAEEAPWITLGQVIIKD